MLIMVQAGELTMVMKLALMHRHFKKSSIFPQMAGIKGTHSRPALFYGINGRLEAYQYINHPILRKHLVEISEAVLNNKYSVYEIFGDDIIKVRSCMLLFATVSDEPIFKQVINKYHW